MSAGTDNAFTGIFIVLMIVTWSSLAIAQDDGQRSLEIYTPRYHDQACPPEYPESRRWIEGFIRVDHMGGILRRFFGDATPESMQDVRLLVDKHDSDVCEYFRHLYDKMINKQVRLFEGAEAQYWHDVTFYEGGEFYFVAIGGGFLIEEDPEQPGKERFGKSRGSGVNVYLKQDFVNVPWAFLDDADLCVDEPGNYLLDNELVREICAAESEVDTQSR